MYVEVTNLKLKEVLSVEDMLETYNIGYIPILIKSILDFSLTL